MKVITNVSTNSKLNAKAADLAPLLGLYNKCLFPTDDIFNSFVGQLRDVIDNLNKQYPRTKPFELYNVSEYCITITVQGSPEKVVAHLNTTTIKVFTDNESIYPIADLTITNNADK